jgi:hypothetical protein
MKTRKQGLLIAKLFLCLCAAAAVYGCAAARTQAGGNVSAQAKTYEMKVGEEKAVAGADFTVLLAAVPEDSRCPEGVNCIWAGTVGVELVFCGPKSEKAARLSTNTPPRVLKYRGRYFRILGVSPRKIEGKEIKPADYAVALEVSTDRPASEGADDLVEIKDE